MASIVLDQGIEEAKELTPQQERALQAILDRIEEEEERVRGISKSPTGRVRGKYAHLQTSSEEFAARKREDLEFEEPS